MQQALDKDYNIEQTAASCHMRGVIWGMDYAFRLGDEVVPSLMQCLVLFGNKDDDIYAISGPHRS